MEVQMEERINKIAEVTTGKINNDVLAKLKK